MDAPLVQVWVIQDTRSGCFLGRDLEMHQSLSRAGRCFNRQSALDTAVCQLGYEYELHTFYEWDQ